MISWLKLSISFFLIFWATQGSGVISESNCTIRGKRTDTALSLFSKIAASTLFSVPLPTNAVASSKYSWPMRASPLVAEAASAYYDSSAYSYLPNPADMTNEGNVQRVMAVLDGNIKQWSFIEAQLLEPNVNLGMVTFLFPLYFYIDYLNSCPLLSSYQPEIFIPLRHLTTTLEVLGNMYFMREENFRARDILERACPLMELLPAAAYSSSEYRVGASCFDLLKDVYSKMDEVHQPFDVNRRITELRLPYTHFLTDKNDMIGDRANIRHNSRSAINALRTLFGKFVNNEDSRPQAVEETRFLLSTLKNSFNVQEDLTFEFLDVMTSITQDGISELTNEQRRLQEQTRSKYSAATQEDKDRLFVLNSFLNAIGRSKAPIDSPEAPDVSKTLQGQDLFVRMLSIEGNYDSSTADSAFISHVGIGSFDPNVAAGDDLHMHRAAIPNLKSDNTFLLATLSFLSLLIISVSFISSQSSRKKNKYRNRYGNGKRGSAGSFGWMYSFFGIETVDDSDNEEQRATKNSLASKSRKDKESDLEYIWSWVSIVKFCQAQWTSMYTVTESVDAPSRDTLKKKSEKEKNSGTKEKKAKATKYMPKTNTNADKIIAISSTVSTSESSSESESSSDEDNSNAESLKENVSYDTTSIVSNDFKLVNEKRHSKMVSGTDESRKFRRKVAFSDVVVQGRVAPAPSNAVHPVGIVKLRNGSLDEKHSPVSNGNFVDKSAARPSVGKGTTVSHSRFSDPKIASAPPHPTPSYSGYEPVPKTFGRPAINNVVRPTVVTSEPNHQWKPDASNEQDDFEEILNDTTRLLLSHSLDDVPKASVSSFLFSPPSQNAIFQSREDYPISDLNKNAAPFMASAAMTNDYSGGSDSFFSEREGYTNWFGFGNLLGGLSSPAATEPQIQQGLGFNSQLNQIPEASQFSSEKFNSALGNGLSSPAIIGPPPGMGLVPASTTSPLLSGWGGAASGLGLNNIFIEREINISITTNCTLLHPTNTAVIKFIMSGSDEIFLMRRSIANPALWGLTLKVSNRLKRLNYRYVAVDMNKAVWTELGFFRMIALEDRTEIEIEDLFSNAELAII